MIYIDESKATRNTKMGATWELGLNDSVFKNSNSDISIDPENAEIITFDAPDVVFSKPISRKNLGEIKYKNTA
jgi:hypothetical protein